MKEEKILIIKDPEDEIYYALIKEKFDSENERTIIASGENEFEALKEAIEKYIEALNNCQKFIGDFLHQVCDNEFYRNDKICVKNKRIDRPLILEDFTSDSFDAMVFDEESKSWHRMYR